MSNGAAAFQPPGGVSRERSRRTEGLLELGVLVGNGLAKPRLIT